MLFTSFCVFIVLSCSSAWSASFTPPTLAYNRQFEPNSSRISFSKTHGTRAKRDPSPVQQVAGPPTPDPTGSPSPFTTVHINNDRDFALLLPGSPGGLISDAEGEAISFCYDSHGCARTMPDGLITGAHVSNGTSGSLQWIQVTGCINPSKYQLSKDDQGGQFDVRFPQGAQCSFGGYRASFIEQVEPAASRFCLRCCSSPGDQTNCNSHHDRDGCLVAVPGVYSFSGVSCDN